jgi:hypothetical protein
VRARERVRVRKKEKTEKESRNCRRVEKREEDGVYVERGKRRE